MRAILEEPRAHKSFQDMDFRYSECWVVLIYFWITLAEYFILFFSLGDMITCCTYKIWNIMHAMQVLKLPFVFYPFIYKRYSASHVQRVLCLFIDLEFSIAGSSLCGLLVV